MKNIRYISLYILIIFLFSCGRPEAPEFISVDNIKVNTTSGSRIRLLAEARFHNPNDRDMVLKKADIDVFFNEKLITNYNKDYNLKIEKGADFTVPVDVELSLKDLDVDLFSSALSLLSGKKPEIRYDGHIRVKAYGVGIRVPVKGKSEMNLKF